MIVIENLTLLACLACFAIASPGALRAENEVPGAKADVVPNPPGSEAGTGPSTPLQMDDTEAELIAEAAATQSRTNENAVTQAQDAFGFSVGKETLGLYTNSNVRGFSPIAAGNVRIEGLYFDQVFGLTNRVRQSSSIRIGLSSQGNPFPSPTGIVDYRLFKPGEAEFSALVSVDTYVTASIEADAVVPLVDEKLSLGFGAYLANNETADGTDGFHNIQGVMFHWRPTPNIELLPFWTRSEFRNDERGPLYVPAGSYLPPRIPLRQFAGPEWADFDSVGITQGIVGAYSMSPEWLLRAGLFWSELDDSSDFVNLLTNLQPDGSANRVIIADPQSETSSTSGELRLSRSIRENERHHLVHLSVRGRDRAKRYGGSDSIDFGATTIYETFDVPEPEFQFGPQSNDRVRQWTGGLAYEGRWPGHGELSMGASYTDYQKEVQRPGSPTATTSSTPWLFYGSVAANVSDSMVVYASYTEGLEESGVAPDNALNRGQPLPAILTNQREVGLRYALTQSLTLVTGVFDLNKPYYNLDQNDVFTLLGDIRNRGLEVSFSGALTPNLNIVAGAVLLDPEVTGEGVTLGRIGDKPVGLSTRTIILNADWKTSFLEGLSFDIAASYAGRIITTRDNLTSIPPRTLLDLGGRYRFQIAERDATLRFRVTNVTDKEGFVLQGAGSYDAIAGRVASVYLAVDF